MKGIKKHLIKEALKEGMSFEEVMHYCNASLKEVKEVAKEIWKIKDEFERMELYLQTKYKFQCEMKERMKTKYGFYRI